MRSGFDDVVICTELQTEYLIEGFSFGREHDDRHIRSMADFPADLIAVDTWQHQVKKNQIRLEDRELLKSLFSVIYNSGFKTFFCKI